MYTILIKLDNIETLKKNQHFIIKIFLNKQFFENATFSELLGSWFLLAKCLKITCRRATF